jgi:predicted acyltransferase
MLNTTTEIRPANPAPEAIASSQRLMSVDMLRGFDMFWIIGASSLFYALSQMSNNATTAFLAGQLEHAEWVGFRCYDLIFPLFIFIVGVSLVFSLSRTIEQVGRPEALKRIFRRSFLLFLCGTFLNGGLSHQWPDVRLSGVLNRIALAYFFTGLLFCYLKPRALVAICSCLLIGYWALMTFVPIRDIQLERSNLLKLAEQSGDKKTAELFAADDWANPSAQKDSLAWAAAERMYYATTNRVTHQYGMGLNLADHLDFKYLPGYKYEDFAEAEGLLSTLPSVATCLLGAFAGLLLRNQTVPARRKVLFLVVFGIASVALGWLWGLQFPIIKKIWTSSFVLVAGGYSAILLGIFYLVVDVWRFQGWCQPFVWMGMNSITIYIADGIIGGFRKPAEQLAGGDVKFFFDTRVAQGFGDLVVSLVGLMLAFWLVHFLYRKKIFIRL